MLTFGASGHLKKAYLSYQKNDEKKVPGLDRKKCQNGPPRDLQKTPKLIKMSIKKWSKIKVPKNTTFWVPWRGSRTPAKRWEGGKGEG